MYVLVSEGDASTEAPVVELNPSGGLQTYDSAPVAIRVVLLPKGIKTSRPAETFGRGNKLTVTLATPGQEPAGVIVAVNVPLPEAVIIRLACPEFHAYEAPAGFAVKSTEPPGQKDVAPEAEIETGEAGAELIVMGAEIAEQPLVFVTFTVYVPGPTFTCCVVPAPLLQL